MAYTTINKSTDYINTKLHSGTNSTTTVTGVGFQPDMTWWKSRNNVVNHALYDAVRGGSKLLRPNQNNAEETNAAVSAFTSDGVTLTGGDSFTNASGYTYASWNWKAGGGQGSSNTAGSINTTYTSVNTTAGFSISKYTGNGTSGATIGHGLGAVPKWIIVKALNTTDNWEVYHASLGAEKYIELNLSAGEGDSTAIWNDTAPTDQLFTIGNNGGVNTNGNPYIAYCFAEKPGYSRFGAYTGNGNADGTFIYTGFKPAWVMIKRYDNSGEGWWMFDNKRSTSGGTNVVNSGLQSSVNNTEYSNNNTFKLDFLSNGFKLRNSDGALNTNGGTYIYMAFGQSIVGSNNIPATAR